MIYSFVGKWWNYLNSPNQPIFIWIHCRFSLGKAAARWAQKIHQDGDYGEWMTVYVIQDVTGMEGEREKSKTVATCCVGVYHEQRGQQFVSAAGTVFNILFWHRIETGVCADPSVFMDRRYLHAFETNRDVKLLLMCLRWCSGVAYLNQASSLNQY